MPNTRQAKGDPVAVLLTFNALAMLSAIICARRSYRRYGSAGRAMMAGVAGLLVLPLIVVVAVSVAAPQAARVG